MLLEALRPPPGYTLNHALGTSFSLDLMALVAAPLAFTAYAWEDEDGLWTDFPPPDDFDGEEEGSWGYDGYQRTLSAAEQARVDGDTEEALAEKRADAEAARNLYFRFDSASGDDGRQKGGGD